MLNQLDLAIGFSTAGRGVDFEKDLSPKDPMIRSLFKFHVHDQIRTVLFEISVALPQPNTWNVRLTALTIANHMNESGEFIVHKAAGKRKVSPMKIILLSPIRFKFDNGDQQS